MNPHESVPSDQFARCKEELRKLNFMVEEIQRVVDVADALPRYRAQQALQYASHDIETAGHWVSKALGHLGVAV